MTESFTNPFRYEPHPLVRDAAQKVISKIESSPELSEAFAEGKMLGVLICQPPSLCHHERNQGISILYAFSGNVGGRSHIEGFVPPIFDLLDPQGHFRQKEAEISDLTVRIRELEDAMETSRRALDSAVTERDRELERLRERNAARKRHRDAIRKGLCADRTDSAALIKESQFEKAEFKRMKDRLKASILAIEEKVRKDVDRISELKRLRTGLSETLQQWIFRQYIVHNALGESMSVWDIFAERGIVPPGGTGECAAPKLLEHAYRNGLKPLAMGEFWYGRSPETAVRTHGHFYPSCTSKCGPLLTFMTSGLEGMCVEGTFSPPGRGCLRQQAGVPGAHALPDQIEIAARLPKVIYEDEWIVVVEKPSGMPSVPGLGRQTSLLEWLDARNSGSGTVHEAVHRLDMDTSGIMLFAKNPKAAVNLRKQFEEHTVRKTYMARLCPSDHNRFTPGVHDLKTGETGRIDLPLSADYDERPRQKVDMMHGKPTLTLYEVSSVNTDGTIDILFHPHTGRTHQLRVHAAHILGLGRPILGDTLYGGCHTSLSVSDAAAPTPHRLHLHALSITFTHPGHDSEMTFTSTSLAY